MASRDQARRPIAMFGCALAVGLLFTAIAATSDRSGLRSTGGDAASVVQQRTDQIADRRSTARRLESEIEALAAARQDLPTGADRTTTELRVSSGLEPVQGRGLRIELSDTPREFDYPDINPNLLVVHQQDIQAFVNAMWAGGAKAVALQDQRLVSTSGIKCVGNTVIIDGVPYSPPYVIAAVGEPRRLREALEHSPEVKTYWSYAKEFQLGLAIDDVSFLHIDGYTGPIAFAHAKPLPKSASSSRSSSRAPAGR